MRPGPTFALLIVLGAACSQSTTELLRGRDTGGAATDDAGASPADAADATAPPMSMPDASGSPPSGAARCGDHDCACDDTLDQDGDMLVDGLDPECTGPYDDDEASFGTGLGGEALAECQGCFWHGAAMASRGACSRPLACTFGAEPAEGLEESCGGCAVTSSCSQACLRSTPNGCDCFGCCEATTSEGPVHFLLAGTCSLRDVEDETKCPRCTPSAECQNPCGTCELCGTKKRKDLARECRGMGAGEPQSTCDEGETVCDERTPCPETSYCQLGCCRVVVL